MSDHGGLSGWGKLALVLGAVVAALLLSEIGLRIGFACLPSPDWIRRQQGLYQKDAELSYVLSRNAARGDTVHTDSRGFRGAERELKKPYILCVGDSTMFGAGASNDSGTLPAQLETAVGVRCLNGGAVGYRLWQVRGMLETYLKQYQPCLVIVCAGWNDIISIQTLGATPRSDMLHPRSPWDTRSYVWGITCRAFGVRTLDRLQLEAFERHVAAIRKMCGDHQIPVLFLKPPTILSPAMTVEDQKRLAVLTKGKSSPTLLNAYRAITSALGESVSSGLEYEKTGKAKWIKDHCHPNDEGYRVIVQHIAGPVRALLGIGQPRQP